MAQADCVTNPIRAPITGVGAKPSTKPGRMAYANFIANGAAHPPRSIPPDPGIADLEDRVDHLSQVLTALPAYVTTILDETAWDVPGGLDLRQIDAFPTSRPT
jgi:hypothetical protein